MNVAMCTLRQPASGTCCSLPMAPDAQRRAATGPFDRQNVLWY